jgi:hypothetical protein
MTTGLAHLNCSIRVGQRVITYMDLHLCIEVVFHDQAMGHPNAVRFHRMAGFICKVTYVHVVKVVDLFL